MITKSDINFVRELSAERSVRRREGLFVAEGAKLVADLASSGMAVRKVFHSGGFSLPGVDCELASSKDMERLSRLKTPSGVVALVEMPQSDFDSVATPGALVLALDGVQDPGNMGTIIRTADWFGVRDILCSANSADCFNPKVVQATMGAIARVRVHYGDLPAMLAATGAAVYGTFLEGDSIYDAAISRPAVVVMGSEGRGISPAVEAMVSRRIFIPSYPAGSAGSAGSAGGVTSESLNVAAAAAVICAEIRRRG